MSVIRLSTLLLTLVLTTAPAWAYEPDWGTLTLEYENDIFGGEDRYYTNGARLTWMSPDDHVPTWVKRGAALLPFFAVQGELTLSYSLGQNIYTPNDIRVDDPPENDRPYAGWLYLTVGLGSETDYRVDRLQLSVGVVGPASLADRTQRFVHDAMGAKMPAAWDSQLANEPALLLSYERQWRSWIGFADDGWGWDGTPYTGVALGNVFTQANIGFTVRFGRYLPMDWGPPRITPTLPGSGVFRPRADFGWYLFAGVDGRAVLQNLFLDGNTFTDSRSVDKRVFVGELQLGGAMNIGRRTRLTYTQVLSTREFRTQRGSATEFGTVSLSMMF
ncbi:MAG: lipid A deacylase LpxR family protein [Aquisalimonadaceae bacterium]